MFEKIFDLIKNNFKNPKLYVFLLVVLLTVLVLFPYIDANFFYYNRVNDRIDILTKVSEINVEQIQENEILYKEYNSILTEIEKQSSGNIGSVFIKEADNTVNLIKFITGGVLLWLIALLCLFIKGFKNWGHRILGFVFFAGLGCVFGLAAKAIPTIANPMVNYIGFPVLLIIVIALPATGGKNKKNV